MPTNDAVSMTSTGADDGAAVGYGDPQLRKCAQCGTLRTMPRDFPADPRKTVRFGCPHCSTVTEHRPLAGNRPRSERPEVEEITNDLSPAEQDHAIARRCKEIREQRRAAAEADADDTPTDDADAAADADDDATSDDETDASDDGSPRGSGRQVSLGRST